MQKQRHERLAVRARVQRAAAVRSADWWPEARFAVAQVNLGRHVVETLRPQEIAISRLQNPARQTQIFVQPRVRLRSRKAKIARAALGVETRRDRDALEQGGFTRSVLADQKRHILVQLERVQCLNRGQVERVLVKRSHVFAAQRDGNQKLRFHWRSLASLNFWLERSVSRGSKMLFDAILEIPCLPSLERVEGTLQTPRHARQ